VTDSVEPWNVGHLLTHFAQQRPDQIAVAEPQGRDRSGRIRYRTVTFAQLDRESEQLARGLLAWGVPPGTRLALLVPQSIEFVALVFALFKAGMVSVLIDPGMGRTNILRCLAAIEPAGFIGVPLVQALRVMLRGRFPHARWNVTVGKRWFWGGLTLPQLRSLGAEDETRPRAPLPRSGQHEEAAIIFTTGSTGPPKGVLYRHGNFWRQVTEIRDHYGIQPGEIDLAGFPLFALFNAGMGVTTIIPDMDPTRPAQVRPENILDAVNQWQATQSFGSPALWNVVGRYCEQTGARMPSLRRVLSAGAPVPEHVLRRMVAAIAAVGEVYTPYGATEALPVASHAAREALNETAARTAQGRGTCVGRRFPGVEWKVIRITDEPLLTLAETEEVPLGTIGELLVRGDVVTREYLGNEQANALHKVRDGDTIWHRLGDVGYCDQQERFWFCGRKSHRVRTSAGDLFTEPCEAILNQHPHVYRSALVGVGPPGNQQAVAIVEPWPEHWPSGRAAREELLSAVRALAAAHPTTQVVRHVLLKRQLPVDIRHNAKIFREKLVPWATAQLRSCSSG
jgi:acyl-CoA synthetase (AMP-forming)/AMP-acid ligase II